MLLNINKHPMIPIKTYDESFLPNFNINYNPNYLASLASKKSYPPIYSNQYIAPPSSSMVANIPSGRSNFDKSAIRLFK